MWRPPGCGGLWAQLVHSHKFIVHIIRNFFLPKNEENSGLGIYYVGPVGAVGR